MNFNLHPKARIHIFGYYDGVKASVLDMARLGWLWCNWGTLGGQATRPEGMVAGSNTYCTRHPCKLPTVPMEIWLRLLDQRPPPTLAKFTTRFIRSIGSRLSAHLGLSQSRFGRRPEPRALPQSVRQRYWLVEVGGQCMRIRDWPRKKYHEEA